MCSNGCEEVRALGRPGLFNFFKARDELPHFTLKDVHEFSPRHCRKRLCLCNSGCACRRALPHVTAQRSNILAKEFLGFALQLLKNTHLVPMLGILERFAEGVKECFSGYFPLKEFLKRSQVLF